MRSKHGDLFAYVRSSKTAVPYDAPRSSLLGAAAAGPGGLPRVTAALNRLGVKKAKPQRRPSLPPEPLPPAPVDAVAVAPALVQPPPPVPDAGDLLTAELDALLAKPSQTLEDVAVPGTIGAVAPGAAPGAGRARRAAPRFFSPSTPPTTAPTR